MERTMVPWRGRLPPFFGDFEREVENVMEQFFANGNGARGLQAFAPRATVAETDNQYEVEVDLPGIKLEDLQVEMRCNELWVAGERKQQKEEKGKNYHRIEQEYGRFERVIPLAAPVSEDKIKAHYQNGVLKITVPKSEAVRPKRVAITS
ncbi:MAG: Hsp20/alpha crystallin family protein [Thermoguttaceae bacterium]